MVVDVYRLVQVTCHMATRGRVLQTNRNILTNQALPLHENICSENTEEPALDYNLSQETNEGL